MLWRKIKQRREMVRMIRGNFTEQVTFEWRPVKRLWNKPYDIWEKSVPGSRNKTLRQECVWYF